MHALLLILAFFFAEAHPRHVRAIELPVRTRALRHAGALEVDIQIALAGAQRHRLPPADVVVVFGDYYDGMVLYGPVQGFGPFLVGRWDAGVRGPALSTVIYREYSWKKHKGHGPWDAKHGGKHHGGPGWAASNGHGSSRNAWKGGGGHGKSHGSSHGSSGKGRGGHGKGNDHGKGK